MSDPVMRMLSDLLARVEQLERGEYALYQQGTWTPTFTGFSANPTGVIAHYITVGKLCWVSVNMQTAGTSNATGFIVSAPFTSANIANYQWANNWWLGIDNGGILSAVGYANILPNTNYFNVYKATGASWTASGTKSANFQLCYEMA